MKCQICGRDDASVHVLDIRGGRRRNLWLCLGCARELNPGTGPAGEEPDEGEERPGNDPGAGEDGLVSFMGHSFAAAASEEAPSGEASCPACGYTLSLFARSNRLGCAQCYEFFRPRLQSMLGRFHRHASHLGKVPRQAGAAASPVAEIMRLRVALEKAIVAEDFEEAARLRDRIRQLEAAAAAEPGEGA